MSIVDARAAVQRLPVEGLLSALLVLIAGVVAIASGLLTGSASEGGIGVALSLAALFMMHGELRAAGLRERCGSSATTRSR